MVCILYALSAFFAGRIVTRSVLILMHCKIPFTVDVIRMSDNNNPVEFDPGGNAGVVSNDSALLKDSTGVQTSDEAASNFGTACDSSSIFGVTKDGGSNLSIGGESREKVTQSAETADMLQQCNGDVSTPTIALSANAGVTRGRKVCTRSKT